MADSIVRTITIAAPIETVWDALTDHEKFGTWFRVALDQPFEVGKVGTGKSTYPGYECNDWLARVVTIEKPTLFEYRWPATGGDSDIDPASLPDDQWTLVSFVLRETEDGTELTVTESGFDKVPEPRRGNVLRSNSEGWTVQVGNIRDYVEAA